MYSNQQSLNDAQMGRAPIPTDGPQGSSTEFGTPEWERQLRAQQNEYNMSQQGGNHADAASMGRPQQPAPSGLQQYGGGAAPPGQQQNQQSADAARQQNNAPIGQPPPQAPQQPAPTGYGGQSQAPGYQQNRQGYEQAMRGQNAAPIQPPASAQPQQYRQPQPRQQYGGFRPIGRGIGGSVRQRMM